VGNVTRIAFGRDPKDRRIVLTLSVERRVQDRIREDSVASIGTIGLVGDKVLDITVGSHDRPGLRPGAELASTDPPDYAQLLKKGDRILDNVTRITASLDEFLAGGESTGKRNLNEALRSLRTTLVEVEKGQGLLHDIIYGREGAELLARMDRTVQSLEKVAKTVEVEGSPLLVRMDRTLQSVEKLAGTLETEAGPLLSRVDRTVQSLENIAKALETEDGLLHALIYTPKDETLGRLTQSLNTLDEILRQARDGQGLLHMLLYESEGAELLARLNRTSEHLEGLARAAREGKGLLPSLLFDPAGAKVLEDVREVAADLRGLAAEMRGVAGDLQTITTRLRQGEGTIGGLLEDPTVYEDLSALLRGANRSMLLRGLIRSTREEGLREKR
jgi:phospholipid/cholesterol/gamma-HCH transport system substrate-binding protein